VKVILSRKGFDSDKTTGGGPSPILPEGDLLSLPIKDNRDNTLYKELLFNGNTYLSILQQLGYPWAYDEKVSCHLDPDIRPDCIKREKDWKPSLGQIDAAQKHLMNNGVKEGDLFLFFGWFAPTERYQGVLRYVPGGKNGMHVMFGYLQVGEILRMNKPREVPDWLKPHPHTSEIRFDTDGRGRNNTIYVARNNLTFAQDLPGAGYFPKYSDSLRLTKAFCQKRTHWELPDFLREARITYHSDPWKDGYFKSACRGQEFVIHHSDPDLLAEWVTSIIRKNIR